MKRTVFIIIILMVACLLQACSNDQTGSKITNGNIANGGNAAWDGEWIYFENGHSSGTTDEKFYRINPETGEYQCLLDTPVKNIIVLDGQLNYISTALGNDRIIRSNLDGTAKKVIVDDRCDRFWIEKGFIFYTYSRTESDLYQCYLDGSNIRYLFSAWSFETIYKDRIYFWEKNGDDKTLFSANLDGSDKTNITSKYAYQLQIANDKIYYSKPTTDYENESRENSGIHVMDLDGNNHHCLQDVHVLSSINVTDQYIYYSYLDLEDDWEKWEKLGKEEDPIYYVFMYRGQALMRMDLNGENIIQLADPRCDDIHIVGNYIFYHSLLAESYEPKLMKKDGSEYVPLPGALPVSD